MFLMIHKTRSYLNDRSFGLRKRVVWTIVATMCRSRRGRRGTGGHNVPLGVYCIFIRARAKGAVDDRVFGSTTAAAAQRLLLLSAASASTPGLFATFPPPTNLVLPTVARTCYSSPFRRCTCRFRYTAAFATVLYDQCIL